MSELKQIAIDVDATIYDFETIAREGYLKLAEERGDRSITRGAYQAWRQWRDPDDICGHDVWMDVIKLCHQPEIISQQVPYRGTVETINALYEEGYELLYISNRDAGSWDATYEWLASWGFPISPDDEDDHTALVCTFDDKHPYMVNCQYLIDDRPKTCVEFVYDHSWHRRYERDILQGLYKRKAFMMMYQYNENLTDIPGIYLSPSWAGLNRYFVEKGVLSKPAHIALGVNSD